MALEQKLHLKLAQRLVMTPSLQQAIKMLQMTRLELAEAVNQEIVENPVLEDEEEEQAPAPEAEAAREESREPETPAEPAEDPFREIDYEAYFQDYMDAGFNPRQYEEEHEEYALENTLAQAPDLADHLLWQLSLSAGEGEVRRAAEFVIGNLDEDGYLRVSREEIAAAGPWDPDVVGKALDLVRSFDPPGIAAFDLRDCLRRQVTALGIENPVLDRIFEEHWDKLLNRQFAALARELSVSLPELQAILAILKNLETKPGRQYNTTRTIYVQPDVIIRKIDDEWVIMLNEDGLPRLRISSSYRRMLRGEDGEVGREAKDYLKEKMRSAVWLIKSLEQRRRTIYRVAESIVSHQRDFLDHGIEHLRPLVLRDVATDIGMHESTVSRVVSNKYMLTPRGIVPMKFFFHTGLDSTTGPDVSSVSIKNKIEKMIADEDRRRPLSDAKLTQRLRAEGIQIARRTVAKYREELRIASSSQRKILV